MVAVFGGRHPIPPVRVSAEHRHHPPGPAGIVLLDEDQPRRIDIEPRQIAAASLSARGKILQAKFYISNSRTMATVHSVNSRMSSLYRHSVQPAWKIAGPWTADPSGTSSSAASRRLTCGARRAVPSSLRSCHSPALSNKLISRVSRAARGRLPRRRSSRAAWRSSKPLSRSRISAIRSARVWRQPTMGNASWPRTILTGWSPAHVSHTRSQRLLWLRPPARDRVPLRPREGQWHHWLASPLPPLSEPSGNADGCSPNSSPLAPPL